MAIIHHEVKFLLKHSLVYGLGSMLSRVVAFLLLPLYTRYLTPTDYGVLELIGATSSLLGLVLGLGVTGALARFYYELPPPKQPRLVSTVYMLVAAGAALAFFPCMLASPWLATVVLDGPQYTRHFQIGFASLLIGLTSDINMSYLRLLYRSTASIVVALTSMVLTISINIFLIVWLNFGVLGVLTGNLIAQILIGVPLTFAILYRIGFRPNVTLARDVLAYSAPLIPALLLTAIAANADRYFIKHFVSLADTGIFGLATKLAGSLNLLITSTFMTTFSARRFEIAKQPGAERILARIYDFYVVAFLLPATVLAIFVREILVAMSTPAYYRAGDFVPIILLQLLAVGIHFHVEFGILYSNQTRYFLYANALARTSHVIMAFLLVRTLGVWGATLAGLLSACLHSLVLHLMASRLFYIRFNFVRTGQALLLAATAVALAAVVPAENLFVGITFKVLLSTAFVLSVVWLYNVRALDIVQFARRGPASTAA